jgi:hypothetical protein
METGRAPNLGEIMSLLRLSRTSVLGAYREISQIDTFWVEPRTENIRILSPFANTTTPYRISIDGHQKWYAVCGIEALGISEFFPGRTIEINAYCRDCVEPIYVKMKDGRILEKMPETILGHLGVPVAKWFEDLCYA